MIPAGAGRLAVPMLREPHFSQSLERGLAILSSFSPERPMLGITEVADTLGMTRSTVYRYMSTLVALGYLEQDKARKYRLGLRVADLGMAALNSTELREHAHMHLKELSELAFPASLAVLDGVDIVCVDRVHSLYGLRTIDMGGVQPGSRAPAYATAMGKLMLAFLPKRSSPRSASRHTFP